MVKLNKQQEEAALFTNGIASVIAVPGSGKTLTMCTRIYKLIENGAAPESILSLTFTRTAAQEMRDKLAQIIDDVAQKVNLSTIHSFCMSLLKEEGNVFEILTGTNQIIFIKKVIQKLRIKNVPAGMALREISLAQNNLISSEEFQSIYTTDDIMNKIGNIYHAYEQEKKRKMNLDFNDLLTETYNILKTDDDVRAKYQNIYQHILVDEFQDVSPVQMEILKLLIHDKNSSFWITGDDFQSIFAFIGASVGNILNFTKIFPMSKQFILNKNYRSTPQILSACSNLIKNNTKQIDKTLKTSNPKGEDVCVIEAINETDEAVKITAEIKYLIEIKNFLYKDIAILYRSNNQSLVIEDMFKQNSIPYRIENGKNFYMRFEVKLLLDYLRFINDPLSESGDENLSIIINKPNRYIGKQFMNDLKNFASGRNIHLYEALQLMPVSIPYLKNHIKEFLNIVNPLIQDKDNLEPSDMIYLLRSGLSYDKFISDDDIPSPDDSKIANINQLQIAASKYSKIESLLNYTESFKDKQSNDPNGVSLMTIHKSKGLEFSVVFVIGWVKGIIPNTLGDVEEERRIAFVGISRAMNMLYLTYPQQYLGKNIQKSQFLDEIFHPK